MVMRTYNERIGDVQVDSLGMPIAWTWRNRRYVSDHRLDCWVETTDWWRDLEAVAGDGFGHIEHWLMQASCAHGSVQVELA